MNDAGQAVGASYFPFIGERAVMWENDAQHTVVDLGMLPGDATSTALAANALGQVVGVSISPAGGRRAFLWQAGRLHDLASLVAPEDGTWTINQVFAINNRGQIVAMGRSNGGWASIVLTPSVQ